MRDLDRRVERDYPTPAPEPVRAAKPERAAVLANTAGSPRSPATARSGAPADGGARRVARNRPAPAGGPDPDRRGVRRRFPPVSGALGVRADGTRGKGVKRLVLQAVDPELLEAVVGPQLAPA